MESLLSSLGLKHTETSASYLSYLTTLSPEQINAQPATLGSEAHSVNQSLTALALRQSHSFSSTTSSVLDPLPDITSTVVNLEERIPAIDEAATFNTARLQEIAQSRKDTALLGRNEGRLQEILDIPGMIKVCVVNGHYTEATDLFLHLKRIQSRHPQSSTLKNLLEESDGYMQRMVLQLLTLLNTPLKLGLALKVIGFLRRNTSFSEDELKFLFLRGRYDALMDTWAGIDHLKDTPERYVKKYVEIFREQVFAIITQYTSIFPEDEVVPQVTDNACEHEIKEENSAFQNNLLAHFSQRIITNLHTVIKEYVPRIESQATKNTLLTQILYTSQSMARVGCEFIGLVVQYFGDEKVWMEIVKNQRQMARRLD